jgi:hypothetical protein
MQHLLSILIISTTLVGSSTPLAERSEADPEADHHKMTLQICLVLISPLQALVLGALMMMAVATIYHLDWGGSWRVAGMEAVVQASISTFMLLLPRAVRAELVVRQLAWVAVVLVSAEAVPNLDHLAVGMLPEVCFLLVDRRALSLQFFAHGTTTLRVTTPIRMTTRKMTIFSATFTPKTHLLSIQMDLFLQATTKPLPTPVLALEIA